MAPQVEVITLEIVLYSDKQIFNPPESGDTVVWRYLDFTKFIALLNSSELFFSRADFFNDPLEGSLTKPTVVRFNELFKSHSSDAARKDFAGALESFRGIIGINCWHMNNSESDAMWQLYLKNNEGIAIRSTFSKLKNSIKDTRYDVSASCVQYVDYDQHSFPIEITETGFNFNFYDLYITKRRSFSHEKELRLITTTKKDTYTGRIYKDMHKGSELNGGLGIRIDLKILIESIYISPTSPGWFKKLIEDTIVKFNYDFSIKDSTLRQEPMF